jgi:Asp-tRNA(Asn)/Glu-tRNA(Gln) amidotransferase A subunit family amidase
MAKPRKSGRAARTLKYELEPITDPAVQAALDKLRRQFKDDGRSVVRVRVPKVLRDYLFRNAEKPAQ